MNGPVVIALPGNDRLAESLAKALDGQRGEAEIRRFPDGETYVRLDTPVDGRMTILCCTLDRPDEKIPPILFAAETARDLGAQGVGLVAPYLAYMRQDRRFHEGEALTSAIFAKMLSRHFDWLATLDPHLHRHKTLDEIYSIPSAVMHAAPLLSQWIAREVSRPLLIGPDGESAQWVSAVADDAGAPFEVLTKVRRGDHDVEVSLPHIDRWKNHTPVLVDDIISTGRTMAETVIHLRELGTNAPVCIGVHGIFADGALDTLEKAGAARVVTTNSVPNPTAAIDVTGLMEEGVRKLNGG